MPASAVSSPSPFERRDRRVLRRRQALVERDAALLAVVEDEVGERPPDIEADTMTCFRHDALDPILLNPSVATIREPNYGRVTARNPKFLTPTARI